MVLLTSITTCLITIFYWKSFWSSMWLTELIVTENLNVFLPILSVFNFLRRLIQRTSINLRIYIKIRILFTILSYILDKNLKILIFWYFDILILRDWYINLRLKNIHCYNKYLSFHDYILFLLWIKLWLAKFYNYIF